MAQILVRNLDEKTVRCLKEAARRNGRSLQAEVKMVLERAAQTPETDMENARREILKLRRIFKNRKFPDSATLIRNDRNR